jgi:hypothetical protein
MRQAMFKEPLIYSHMVATVAWRNEMRDEIQGVTRRTRRDLPDLTRNAAHGGINQRFLNLNIS